jgi:hypothetical protein
MRSVACSALIVIALATCGCWNTKEQKAPPTPTPSPHLTARDLRMFVTVRTKALERVEAALASLPKTGGDPTGHIQEIQVAERDSVNAMGVQWAHYLWVKDRVGQLLTLERQAEDRHLLLTELESTRNELILQQSHARDAASRQAIEVRLEGIKRQVEEMHVEELLSPEEQAELALIDALRPEAAALSSRQEAIQKKVKELLDRSQLPSAQTKLPEALAKPGK